MFRENRMLSHPPIYGNEHFNLTMAEAACRRSTNPAEDLQTRKLFNPGKKLTLNFVISHKGRNFEVDLVLQVFLIEEQTGQFTSRIP